MGSPLFTIPCRPENVHKTSDNGTAKSRISTAKYKSSPNSIKIDAGSSPAWNAMIAILPEGVKAVSVECDVLHTAVDNGVLNGFIGINPSDWSFFGNWFTLGNQNQMGMSTPLDPTHEMITDLSLDSWYHHFVCLCKTCGLQSVKINSAWKVICMPG